MQPISPASLLPADLAQALLVGRIWRDGPCVVAVRGGEVVDITQTVATVAELFECSDALEIVRHAPGIALGSVQALLEQALAAPAGEPLLLAPCDLQAVKACGVTFAVSLLERVIEEQAGGDAARAASLRTALQMTLGGDLSALKPGSDAAQRLKQQLQQRGAWSQYMEVGIGPDAEVFKAQPMSSVGCGAQVGLLPSSAWNNPEPEIVLAVNSRGEVLGRPWATTSTCATSKDAAPCCWARPRITTAPAPSAPSSACSTSTSRSTPCARRKCRC